MFSGRVADDAAVNVHNSVQIGTVVDWIPQKFCEDNGSSNKTDY